MSCLVDFSDIVNDNLLMSSWVATERYGLSVAPGGLALVQNLLNTRAIVDKGADLLSDLSAAQTWAPAAASAWSARRGHTLRAPTLTESDVARLRDLREMLSSWVAGEPTAGTSPLPGSAAFTLGDGGEVQWTPTGSGWRWWAAAVWGEILLGQRTGTWRRLKQCRNPHCRSAYYDRSKNNSAVWHDVKVCGNAANLRASRARRRAAAHG